MAKKSARKRPSQTPAKTTNRAPTRKAPARGRATAKTSTKRDGKSPATRTSGAAAELARIFGREQAEATPMPLFVVDAFTRRRYHGNPAAVVVCEDGKFLPEETMQLIAREQNLSETAFIVVKGKIDEKPTKAKSGSKTKPAESTLNVDIRWFSPEMEIDMCGHATLGAAHVLFDYLQVHYTKVAFKSRSAGTLNVHRMEHLYILDMPTIIPKPYRPSASEQKELAMALGKAPSEVYLGRDILAVYDNKRDVHEMTPDFAKLKGLAGPKHLGVIITAPGVGHDFVSRAFYPKAGINEDPVTGSAHCMLTPYWASRLGKAHLSAHQVSHRGGELLCELAGERTLLAGQAITVNVGFTLV